MALSDLAVYSEYAYSAMTEVLTQQIELFNAASEGTITLIGADNQGDYSDKAFFAKISGLVRRRNAYGSGAVTHKVLQHLVDTMVKIAAGTAPIDIDPGQFAWIQQNPEQAGAALGVQLAGDALADMLNAGLGACRIALVTEATNVFDATGLATKTFVIDSYNKGQAKMGDQYQSIRIWVQHSTPLFEVFGQNLANASVLFTYGTVNIRRDPFGRLILVSDSANLTTTVAGPHTNYHSLGLVGGAIGIEQNNDFNAAEVDVVGNENLGKTYQAEWSYNLGIKGFKWDKTNGGHSPNDAAILLGTNWDKFATSAKDLAGVVVITQD